MPTVLYCVACDGWVPPGGHQCGQVRALTFCGECLRTHEPACSDICDYGRKAKIRAALADGSIIRDADGSVSFRMAAGDRETLKALGLKVE